MYKIAILGCENSHANTFLNFIIKDKLYSDIEVVGVYSEDTEAANKLNEKYGVYVAESYDEFVGKLDGVLITARHGDNHYKYAKPYIKSGIPMFIDKPVTVSEDDARAFYNELKENNVKACGGSVCIYANEVQQMKKVVETNEFGNVLGGYLRAPVDMESPYGKFYFYSQHLVQVMQEIFGYYPDSVKAYRNDRSIKCVVRYDKYDVVIEFAEKYYLYSLLVSCANEILFSKYSFKECFKDEFETFYKLLKGEEQKQSYEDLFAPVFILNAIDRSLKSGEEEKIARI